MHVQAQCWCRPRWPGARCSVNGQRILACLGAHWRGVFGSACTKQRVECKCFLKACWMCVCFSGMEGLTNGEGKGGGGAASKTHMKVRWETRVRVRVRAGVRVCVQVLCCAVCSRSAAGNLIFHCVRVCAYACVMLCSMQYVCCWQPHLPLCVCVHAWCMHLDGWVLKGDSSPAGKLVHKGVDG